MKKKWPHVDSIFDGATFVRVNFDPFRRGRENGTTDANYCCIWVDSIITLRKFLPGVTLTVANYFCIRPMTTTFYRLYIPQGCA